MKHIKSFEIINHGYEHEQYFQGCGTSFTDYDDVATGIGNNAREAYDDAVEQLAMGDYDVDKLPTKPRGIRARDKVPAKIGGHETDDFYWYVSIRVK